MLNDLADHLAWRRVDSGTALRVVAGVLPNMEGNDWLHLSNWWRLCSTPLSFLIHDFYKSATGPLSEQSNGNYIVHAIAFSGSIEVQKVSWWMAHFCANTPKRHYAFGNTKMVLALDRGVLRKWKPPSGQKIVTAKRYTDKHGKKRYQGTKALRATEKLGYCQASFNQKFWTLLQLAVWNNHMCSVF